MSLPAERGVVRLVRLAGVALGAVLMLLGLYGLLGLGIVSEQLQMCRGRAAVAYLATSYPADFCQTRDWIAAVLPGIGLLAIGAAGTLLLMASVVGLRRAREGRRVPRGTDRP